MKTTHKRWHLFPEDTARRMGDRGFPIKRDKNGKWRVLCLPHDCPSAMTGILETILPGDHVTIVNRFGQERTGRAVMRGPCGWVLNMGGEYGTPAVATAETITKVKPGRRCPRCGAGERHLACCK